MKDCVIETTSLVKEFKGVQVVKGVDLNIKKGIVYGFLGPNGAGKSTTIKMILGLISSNKGEVKVFGKKLTENREEVLSNIGALVESPSYYGNLTAYENLEITRRIKKLPKEEIDRVINLVKLNNASNKKVKEFSLGMKQRLGIAQALMGDPKLVILDEPTNGLDPSGIHEIRELIKSLTMKGETTVVVSSHILSEIELMADEVGIIKEGELIYEGTIEALKENKGSKIVVEVNDTIKAQQILRKRNYWVIEKDGKIEVKGEGLTPAKLCKELILLGFDVNYLCEEGKSLEDIFLSLTMEGATC